MVNFSNKESYIEIPEKLSNALKSKNIDFLTIPAPNTDTDWSWMLRNHRIHWRTEYSFVGVCEFGSFLCKLNSLLKAKELAPLTLTLGLGVPFLMQAMQVVYFRLVVDSNILFFLQSFVSSILFFWLSGGLSSLSFRLYGVWAEN